MKRQILAGIACFLLLITGATLMWRGSAQEPGIPPAPGRALRRRGHAADARADRAGALGRPKSKEEKRFARADKNEDGRISLAELVEPRRKAFAKLDLDQDGKLGFEEWAVKTIDKFEDADGDKNASLTPAEYAATAPKPQGQEAAACAELERRDAGVGVSRG